MHPFSCDTFSRYHTNFPFAILASTFSICYLQQMTSTHFHPLSSADRQYHLFHLLSSVDSIHLFRVLAKHSPFSSAIVSREHPTFPSAILAFTSFVYYLQQMPFTHFHPLFSVHRQHPPFHLLFSVDSTTFFICYLQQTIFTHFHVISSVDSIHLFLLLSQHSPISSAIFNR